MPPKVGKKAVAKKKERLLEDKTFGLKNKNKSKKVQAFVAQVSKQVFEGGTRKTKMTPEERAAEELRKMKREKKLAEKEMAMLMGIEVPKKKKKKQTDEEAAAAAEEAPEEFKSAAEMAKEEFAASLEAMATVPPVSMVEVTLDGTLEIGDHAIETVEDEIERRREELRSKTKPTAGRPVGATAAQLAQFKKKRDAVRMKEQKKAEIALYGKGGRKGLCGREIILRNIKSGGGVALDAPEDDDEALEQAGAGAPSAAATAAASAAVSGAGADPGAGEGEAGVAATVGDADIFLQGDDDDDLDDLEDDDDEEDEDEDEDEEGAAARAEPATAVA